MKYIKVFISCYVSLFHYKWILFRQFPPHSCHRASHSFFMFILISWRGSKRKLIYFIFSPWRRSAQDIEYCRNQGKSFDSKQWSLEQLIVLLIYEINLISPFWMSFRCFLSMKENTEKKIIYKNGTEYWWGLQLN